MFAEQRYTCTTGTVPSYSATAYPPIYCPHPTLGEQSLLASPVRRPPPTGTYTKRSGDIVLTLTEQEEHDSSPSYGRQGSVNGIIDIGNRKPITEVHAKLEGEMVLVVPDRSAQTTQLFKDEHLLWKCDPSSSKSSSLCPSQIPFTCTFPLTFAERGTNDRIPLPPSLKQYFPGHFSAHTKYCLKIKIVRGRHPIVRRVFTGVKTIVIPINYSPRTRPPYSIRTSSDFLTDLKIAPEEWHQTVSTINSIREHEIPGVECHLFVPSLKIFSFLDRIPVHISLTGSLRSLQDFVISPSADSTQSQPIRLYILRQLLVQIHDHSKYIKNTIIGEGSVQEIPPHKDDMVQEGIDESNEGVLNWKGELSICNHGVGLVGGFDAGALAVRDFIVLQVRPLSPNSSLLLRETSVRIKLVTDVAGSEI
ncbi:hypothetical protein K435DRAFT_689273 [Dendrothele bispora CBS 962.96]|uniref:Arrestin-like N-terminal domain-containing protein n=1 Tax=Dendrothele bispora (strain CBS 962.96) TaxID=1314807 RepID=A0A4S8L4U3_DENBC|nr:hypothetical protein K435DRAFT_689273 [Dendrothele bispora CBS 962.96]